MLPTSIFLLVSAAFGSAIAKPVDAGRLSTRQTPAANALAKQKVLVGGGATSNITIAQFDGAAFNILNTVSTGSGESPSWLAFKEPNIVYSVNENGANLRAFSLDLATNSLKQLSNVTASGGVVHLEFNKDKTRLVGASFGQGVVDVWEIAQDGSLKVKKTGIKTNETAGQPGVFDPTGPSKDFQATPHAHQSLLDNSGRFFFVNDLGLDSIVVLDSKDDDFKVVGRTKVQPGCGPRHGAFYPPGAPTATHYLVVCELLNTVIVHSLNYSAPAGIPQLTATQAISTFGSSNPPAPGSQPHAGELVASADGKSIYVSNRLSFSPNDTTSTDTIVRFATEYNAAARSLQLAFAQSISSQGRKPRMVSLSPDAAQPVFFGTNQGSGTGLVAFSRCPNSGSLSLIETSKVGFDKFVSAAAASQPDIGPQFVVSIPNTLQK